MENRPSTVGVKVCRKKGIREMGTSWEGVKREALNILRWMSVRSSVGLRWLCDAASF